MKHDFTDNINFYLFELSLGYGIRSVVSNKYNNTLLIHEYIN
jgi:hypothetical protein